MIRVAILGEEVVALSANEIFVHLEDSFRIGLIGASIRPAPENSGYDIA